MRRSIYNAFYILFFLTFWGCRAITNKVNLKVTEFNLVDTSKNKVDSLEIKSKLFFSITLYNQDSINYENLILKLSAVCNLVTSSEKTTFVSLKKNETKTLIYEAKKGDSLRLGQIIYLAELYYDTLRVAQCQNSLILYKEKENIIAVAKQDSIEMQATVITTNPEFYSHTSNVFGYNVPIFMEIRVQHKGKIPESNLKVRFISIDSSSVKVINNSQLLIPILNPDTLILNTCLFKIDTTFKDENVGIQVELYRENIASPIYLETYWHKFGSFIEKRE